MATYEELLARTRQTMAGGGGGTGSTTGRNGTLPPGAPAPGLIDPGPIGGAGSVSGSGMTLQDAQRTLGMSTNNRDPKVWEAYKMIYGKPHGLSPEGQAAKTAQAGQPPSQSGNPYTSFRDDTQQGYYPGRDTVDRGAALEGGKSMQEYMDDPLASKKLGYSVPGSGFDSAGQPFNENQYLDDESGKWLGEQLGWDFTPGSTYDGGMAGQMPSGGYFTDPSTGQNRNAGLIGGQFERMQGDYQRQLKNYERNLAQNPSIVGTGFLDKPGDIMTMFKDKLNGGSGGTNNGSGLDASAINSLAGAGNNASGQPLGAGGPNVRYGNAPTGPNNPVDQSKLPGTQLTPGDPTNNPFFPSGPLPGSGPGGNQSPGLPWPGYTPPGGGGGSTPPPGGGGFGPVDPGIFPGAGGGGWQGGGGGGGGNQQPFSQSPIGTSGFNPNPGMQAPNVQQGNPWANLGQPGGGMQSLGQLLTGVDQLRQGGYGLYGGFNPLTGFGGGIGTPGPQPSGGMMSMVPQRPPQQPGSADNTNFYGLQ